MTRGQKIFAWSYGGATALSALAFIAIALLLAFGSTGCGTEKSSIVGPGAVLEDGLTVLPAGAYIRTIEYDGKLVKAWIVDADRNAPHGQPYKVIMILDYPCGAVGPLPEGHGRDCTDTNTPSDEPPTSSTDRKAGDPTADD